ncbi:MAG: hypothetical protein ACPG4W_02815 [Flavobacteriales bacterium]
METPKFLMGDNSQQPDQLYVIHTQDPHFIYNVSEEQFAYLDDNLEEVIGTDDEAELSTALTELTEAAINFCQEEMDNILDFDED